MKYICLNLIVVILLSFKIFRHFLIKNKNKNKNENDLLRIQNFDKIHKCSLDDNNHSKWYKYLDNSVDYMNNNIFICEYCAKNYFFEDETIKMDDIILEKNNIKNMCCFSIKNSYNIFYKNLNIDLKRKNIYGFDINIYYYDYKKGEYIKSFMSYENRNSNNKNSLYIKVPLGSLFKLVIKNTNMDLKYDNMYYKYYFKNSKNEYIDLNNNLIPINKRSVIEKINNKTILYYPEKLLKEKFYLNQSFDDEYYYFDLSEIIILLFVDTIRELIRIKIIAEYD